MPPNNSGSEDLVDTQALESEDQVLTDEEVASAAGGISVLYSGPVPGHFGVSGGGG
jgi:uncharacterized protein GlcG (DUF336 family)